MPDDLRLREICTGLFLGGKSLREVGFPDDWEYDPSLKIYEKDGYDSECDGKKTREKFVITKKQLYEMTHLKRGSV